MKGPGLKNELEVRRLWKCPETEKTLYEDGNITAKLSPFTKNQVWMKLVEEKRPTREQVRVEDFSITEFMEPNVEQPPPKKSLQKPNQEKLIDQVSIFGEGLTDDEDESDDSMDEELTESKSTESTENEVTTVNTDTNEKADSEETAPAKKKNRRRRGRRGRRKS